MSSENSISAPDILHNGIKQRARGIVLERNLHLGISADFVGNKPIRAGIISKNCDNPSRSNQLQSPVAIQADQKLCGGEEDYVFDRHTNLLRSDDGINRVVFEYGTFAFRDGSSGRGPQVYSDTKAAEATQEVNLWIETVTYGHIKRVLPPRVLGMLSKFLFKNAIYLKGQWVEKFDASKTQYYNFYLLDGSLVTAPFMTSTGKQLVSVLNDFKVLALPLKQVQDKGRFFLNIFLPDAKDGLQALVDKVDSQYGFLKRHLPYEQVEVGDLRIPRFSFGSKASSGLEGLGLVSPFNAEGSVSEMVPYGENLYASSKFHESFIEVNEEGMKAAAAYVSVIKKREKIDFVADHPFLFLVREDRTGLVLFSGRVVNPLVGC